MPSQAIRSFHHVLSPSGRPLGSYMGGTGLVLAHRAAGASWGGGEDAAVREGKRGCQ